MSIDQIKPKLLRLTFKALLASFSKEKLPLIHRRGLHATDTPTGLFPRSLSSPASNPEGSSNSRADSHLYSEPAE